LCTPQTRQVLLFARSSAPSMFIANPAVISLLAAMLGHTSFAAPYFSLEMFLNLSLEIFLTNVS
jgi:hypothetical protein